MSTETKSSALDPALMADLEAICNAKGIVRDPELSRRVTERGDRAREETLRLFGVQQIAGEIVREIRDAE